MNKIVTYITFGLMILLSIVYTVRELTQTDYKLKMKHLKHSNDSLNEQVNDIKNELKQRDSLLILNINLILLSKQSKRRYIYLMRNIKNISMTHNL